MIVHQMMAEQWDTYIKLTFSCEDGGSQQEDHAMTGTTGEDGTDVMKYKSWAVAGATEWAVWLPLEE